MNFFFLLTLFLFNFNFIIPINFSATVFYGDNQCNNVNIITYSYDTFEICNNDIITNKCNIIYKLDNFSTKAFCGFDSLDNTQSILNNDGIYMEIFDLNCDNKIGAISITLNNCISFMGQGYLKVTINNQIINSNLYLDNNCKYKKILDNIKNNQNYQPFDLQKCSDKIQIFTKNGLLNLKKNDDLDTDNITIDDDLINIIENNANDEKYSLILTIVFSIFVSFLLFIQY